jgi:NTP pyrophosphatase (non-canonical NTP hydrolase)
MEITELQEWVNQMMVEKGFKERYVKIRESIAKDFDSRTADEVLGFYMGALLATEPSEYIDAVKKGKGEKDELEEAADTIIRALNIFIMHDASAEQYLINKMKKNFDRPYMFGHAK